MRVVGATFLVDIAVGAGTVVAGTAVAVGVGDSDQVGHDPAGGVSHFRALTLTLGLLDVEVVGVSESLDGVLDDACDGPGDRHTAKQRVGRLSVLDRGGM